MEKFKAEQYFSEEGGPPKEKVEKIEIPEKDWQVLKIISQRVGGDFRMEVKLGEPGRGSFFNPEDGSITLDPLHIKENPELAKFVAAHEGSHRAITPSPKELGLSQEQIRKLYSQIGFGYLQNAIEDPAVNDWMRKRFPGLQEYTKKIYDDQFKEENAILYAVDPNSEEARRVKNFRITHGYWPKFIQYGSEIIRDWHQKRFSKKLDPAVDKALQRTIDYARESISTIPDPEKPSREKKEIISVGQKRFENNTNYIWPEVKKLVEMDFHIEEIRQMLNDFMKGEEESNPLNDLPEDVKKELKTKIDEAVKKAVKELEKEIEEGEKSGKDVKEIKGILEGIKSGKEVPYPIDELSDDTKKELEKLFNKLPRQKREELGDKAKKQLEDLEDAANKGLEGKLNKDKPESHQERREREKVEREAAKKSEEARIERERNEIERERIKKELERMRREKMTPYEKARAEVVELIDSLYYHLGRILKPEEYGGEEAGYPTGQKLDITRAMQAEKDILQKQKLWIRETAPEKKDYRFWHLVDLSGSMAGEKIEETFKGFIVVGEAIDRVENLNSDIINIHQGITGFHDKIFPYKESNERFIKEVEDRLSEMPKRTHDNNAGTNTYSATLFALEALKQNLGETGNFLLTFSDGEPNHDIRDKLKKLLKEGKEERKRLKIKVGLIWLGEGEDQKKLQELVKEYGYDFGLVMPAVKPEKGKNFSEALSELLEDIVKNPEKY